MQQKEITIFTEGDSKQSSVWSNVPFFLTSTLESKGYLVNRINVEGTFYARNFYDKFLFRILRKTFMPNTTFAYNRTKSFARRVDALMRKAVKKYPDSCCFLSTSFSFTPSLYTEKPTVLFCDWTYDYYFKYFLKREPDFLETHEVKRQNKVIESASHIFVLFPDVADYMRRYYPNKKIFYLGNVLNAEPFDRDLSSLSTRQSDANILFIGLKKYKEGADSLIQSVIALHASVPNITLDIIGMEICDFNELPSYIRCHGYLDKNIPSQKELYYSLLDNATVYVNTNPVWAGFSSALEALYHYVPVITTPYQSFVETFGNEIPFGYYCDQNTIDSITPLIAALLCLPSSWYTDMCSHAHSSVKAFTWNSYVDTMMDHIKP